MLDECAQTLVFHCVVKGFLIILNVILIIYLSYRTIGDGTTKRYGKY